MRATLELTANTTENNLVAYRGAVRQWLAGQTRVSEKPAYNFYPGLFLMRSVKPILLCSITWVLFAGLALFAGDAPEEIQARQLSDLKYLASDELEGRGVGTEGLNKAAEYIREEFAKAGLDVTRVNGGAFQAFPMTTDAQLGKSTSLSLVRPDGTSQPLELKKDYTPLSFGNGAKLSSGLVFAGYGITAADLKYDDYADLNVKGKVVLVLRRSPRQGRQDSPFAGHKGMAHESLQSKSGNAASHGAAAMLFVSDDASLKKDLADTQKLVAKYAENALAAASEFVAVDPNDAEKSAAAKKKLSEEVAKYKTARGHVEQGENDSLLPFNYGGGVESSRSIPVIHITRAACEPLFQSAVRRSLRDIERDIDADLRPRSFPLSGWSVAGDVSIERVKVEVKNVIGVLDGEGPLADETVVIGAHYDHVGKGGQGSLAPGSTEVHNGADDNASGTVALLELARRLASRKEKLPRRLVFIAFTGEERGLIGSDHYVKHPVFPLEKTVAMLNMDMVGRLLDDKLTVFGVDTSSIWKGLVTKYGEQQQLKIIAKPEGLGPSDHSSFYKMKIPVLHFFTGTHNDYHRPGDDWEKVNLPGMQRVTEMVEQISLDVARAPERPNYVQVKGSAQIERQGSRPYFGAIPDFGTNEPGLMLSGVGGGSPAENAGLKAGDRIVQLDKAKIESLEDFDLALRRFSPGDSVEVTVMRKTEKLTFKVTLDKPRG